MRFRDLARDINRHEQKLENVLLYVDFMDHELPVILLKDGSLLVLFELAGLDYEGLSEDEKEQFSHYARVALEQLPDEGARFFCMGPAEADSRTETRESNEMAMRKGLA